MTQFQIHLQLPPLPEYCISDATHSQAKMMIHQIY